MPICVSVQIMEGQLAKLKFYNRLAAQLPCSIF